MTDERKILERVLDEANGFLDGLPGRRVAARTDVDSVAAALRRPLPDEGAEPLEVIEELIAGVEPGFVATPSGRFFGAPDITVIVGEERHETIDVALRFLGLGETRSIVVPADDQGRIRLDPLADILAEVGNGPLIVCLQAGNVHSGAFESHRGRC
jgi:hypothetical protein